MDFFFLLVFTNPPTQFEIRRFQIKEICVYLFQTFPPKKKKTAAARKKERALFFFVGKLDLRGLNAIAIVFQKEKKIEEEEGSVR